MVCRKTNNMSRPNKPERKTIKQKSIVEEEEEDTNTSIQQVQSVEVPEKTEVEEKTEAIQNNETVPMRNDSEAERQGPSVSVISTVSMVSTDGEDTFDGNLRSPEVQLGSVRRSEFRMSQLPPIPDDDWMMDVFSTKEKPDSSSDLEKENGMFNPFDGEDEDKESRKGNFPIIITVYYGENISLQDCLSILQ